MGVWTAESVSEFPITSEAKPERPLRRILKWGKQPHKGFFFQTFIQGSSGMSWRTHRWQWAALQQQQLKIRVAGEGVHFRSGPEQEKETIFRVTISHWNIHCGADQAESLNTENQQIISAEGKKLRSSKALFQHFLNYPFQVFLLKKPFIFTDL